jgi:hypothetical protein
MAFIKSLLNLYPFAFKLQRVIPNGALILESGFDYKVNPKSHLKASVGIYQKVAKSKQSGISAEKNKLPLS